MSTNAGIMKNEIVQGLLRVDEVQNLRFQSLVNSVLGLNATAYAAISIVLLILNRLVKECHEEDGCVPATSALSFHLLEFWSAFLFNVTNVFVLIFSNKVAGQQQFPMVFKGMVFVNLAASLISATLISINVEVFEIAAHELEYANELTMAFIDSVFLLTFLRAQSASWLTRGVALVSGGVGLAVAIVQLAIYNGMGFDEHGHVIGEAPAHYFEFSFGLVVGIVTASFAFDNKFRCDQRMEELLDPGCTECSGSYDSDKGMLEEKAA